MAANQKLSKHSPLTCTEPQQELVSDACQHFSCRVYEEIPAGLGDSTRKVFESLKEILQGIK